MMTDQIYSESAKKKRIVICDSYHQGLPGVDGREGIPGMPGAKVEHHFYYFSDKTSKF